MNWGWGSGLYGEINHNGWYNHNNWKYPTLESYQYAQEIVYNISPNLNL